MASDRDLHRYEWKRRIPGVGVGLHGGGLVPFRIKWERCGARASRELCPVSLGRPIGRKAIRPWSRRAGLGGADTGATGMAALST